MFWLSLLFSCTDRAWLSPGPVLEVGSEVLTFPSTPLGESSPLPLPLRNLTDQHFQLLLQADPPFYSPSSLDLPPGESSVEILFQPSDYGDFSSSLLLILPGGLEKAPLKGHTEEDADGDGSSALATGGQDCDDQDPTVFQGAPEVCGDGIDQNCNGLDSDDCDGDGSVLDCDDQDPEIHPGAPDDADGIDNDCDGRIDEDLLGPGSLIFTEIQVGEPAWLEVCAQQEVHLQNLELRTNNSRFSLDNSILSAGECLSLCAVPLSGCGQVVDLHLEPEDQLILLADQVTDSLSYDSTWPEAGLLTWSLDPSHLEAGANDNPQNWCLTEGSRGLPNPPCQ